MVYKTINGDGLVTSQENNENARRKDTEITIQHVIYKLWYRTLDSMVLGGVHT